VPGKFRDLISLYTLHNLCHHHYVVCLGLVHSLFQIEFSRQCDLVFPLSASSVFSFLRHPVDAYVFFLVFPSLLSFLQHMCFRRQFLRSVTKLFGRPWCFPIWLHVILHNFLYDRSTDPVHPSPASHFKTFKVFLIYPQKFPISSTIQSYAPNAAL
jgi:hypothetical protein